MDLDDTLVKVSSDPSVATKALQLKPGVFVQVRPKLYEFLSEIQKHFEIVIFNNSPKLITDSIVELILKNAPKDFNINCIAHVLSKENCCTNEIHNDIKDLDLLVGGESGRVIGECVIVDNSVFCF